MAFVSEMIDQLRDLLDDASDTEVPFATKKLYLNRGIARLWPRLFYVDELSIVLNTEVFDYVIPTTHAGGHVISVEYLPEADPTDGFRFDSYDIIPGDEDQLAVIRLTIRPTTDIDELRFRVGLPIPLIAAADYAAAQSEVWTGPDRAIGLPVLYAMGMISARKIDARQDHTRYSTTQALNGVTDNDLMTASAMWFGQFEAELVDIETPLPPARD